MSIRTATIIFTAPIATATILFGGAGTAHAFEVVTSNDATTGETSYEGTSNDTSDSSPAAGNVIEMPAPAHNYQLVDRTPTGDPVWAWVEVHAPNALTFLSSNGGN